MLRDAVGMYSANFLVMGEIRRADGQRGSERANARGRGAQSQKKNSIRGIDVFFRVKASIEDNDISLIAAGVGFYFLLAIFPMLAALISIYALISDPAQIQQQFAQMGEEVLPQEAQEIIQTQLSRLAAQSSGALGLSTAIGIAVALWSGARGVKAIIRALNIVYGQDEQRGFFKKNLIALMFTLGSILSIIITLTAVAILPALLGRVGLGEVGQVLISYGRWPFLIIGGILALALLYRYGPNRIKAKWQWVSWGSGIAMVLWVVGSIGFSIYVSNFGGYNETYGSLGAVVILLLWLYLSSLFVLLGGTINAEIEHQTQVDSTEGEAKLVGERGANVGDRRGRKRAS
jgi:membrane protein